MRQLSTFENFKTYVGDSNNIGEVVSNVDMIFADPPYFLSKGKNLYIDGKVKASHKGEWDEIRPLDEINDFNMKWLSACRNVLKSDGTIWVSGTYHNIFSVASCLLNLGFKILNIIVWQKSDPRPTLSSQYFSFTAEYIVWARKSENKPHYFDCEAMTVLNDGLRMPDVWQIPVVHRWEMRCGKHPTQKPLKLLYRVILSSTREGETVLDPFAGSCTTGIAANLLGRNFVGVDLSESYLHIGHQRRLEIEDLNTAKAIFKTISSNPNEPMVIVNHARESLRNLMIEKGICYLRAGDSKGSLLVKPGFERLQYVLLHTGGNHCQLFKLKTKGQFQIWTKETLKEYGFDPEHAPYYIVIRFDGQRPLPTKKEINLKKNHYTYLPKLLALSEFT